MKRVNYQRDQPDEFYHRYSYDADNRITQVRTSADGNHWHTDARYFYSCPERRRRDAHGPLQRVELGAHKVQGIDYAYTLQGWLKGINSNLLAPTVDMGRDGDLTDADPSNDLIGRDAYGLSLGYYGAEDYKAIGPQWTNIDGRPFAPIGPGGTLSDEHRPLYNGNIAHTVNTLQPFGLWNSGNGAQGQVLAQVYRYDQLNRLKQARGVEGLTTNNRWQTVTDAQANRYRSTYTYDANGNITAAERWDRDGDQYDQFSYKYEQRGGRLERNRLYQLNDLADAGNLLVNEANGAKDIAYTGDVPFAPEATNINGAYNYRYDQLGNLAKDVREGIDTILWTVAGKVKQVEKTDGTVLTFAYGADGQRLWKEVTPPVLDDTGYREYYIRDAQGNIMATYRSQLIVVPSPEPQGYAASLRVTERPVYGSSRLGTYARWEELYDHPVVSTPAPDPVQPVDLNYELTDHLGNVTAVVTGRLLNGNGGGTPKQAELVSAQGYEAFGSLLPGRNYSSGSYRFGFNGKENDNEVHQASGTFQDYGMRAYDTRVARFFTVDPIAHRYPMLTPFQFASDSPIEAVDLDGLERFHFTLLQDDQGNSVLRLTGVEDIVDGGLFTYFGMEYLDYVMGIPPLVNDRQEFVIHAYYQPIIPGLAGYETAHKETVFPELAAAMEAVEKGEAGFSAIEKIVQNFETGMGLAMPAEGAGARAGKEIVTKTKSGSRIDAFKLAKEMAGSLGDDAITKSGKIQSQKGRIVGLQSADKTRGWRIDFDPKKNEAHYNWWNGKKNGRVIFEGTQDQVESLINALTKTYNKTD